MLTFLEIPFFGFRDICLLNTQSIICMVVIKSYLAFLHCFPNTNNLHLKIDLTKQHFHHTAAAFYMVYYKLICLNRLFCPQTRSINPCHLWFRHPWAAHNLLKRPSYKVTKLWAVLSMSWEEVVIGNWSRPDYW